MNAQTVRRVWTLGEAMAVLVPRGTGPAEQADEVHVGVGGAELNTAIGLARLGHDVTWVGVLADDPWGRRIVRELRGEGVDPRPRWVTGTFTAAYLREHRATGLARTTYMRRGAAGSHLDTTDLDRFTMHSGDLLHLTGVTPALSKSAWNTWVEAVCLAVDRDAHVSLDVNYRGTLWPTSEAASAFQIVAPGLDLVLASIDEAALVTGNNPRTPEEAAQCLRDMLRPDAEVVIKTGAAGSLHVDGAGQATAGRALPVTVRDLVGAGDAFAAGYLSGVLDDLPAAERLARGHACAAFVVATDGDWEGAPRRTELALANTLHDAEVHR